MTLPIIPPAAPPRAGGWKAEAFFEAVFGCHGFSQKALGHAHHATATLGLGVGVSVGIGSILGLRSVRVLHLGIGVVGIRGRLLPLAHFTTHKPSDLVSQSAEHGHVDEDVEDTEK